MITKKKTRTVFLLVAAGILPFLFLLLISLDPSMFAAASGWYGYNGTPVVPEVTSLTRPFHGVNVRNNQVLVENGSPVQYLNGVLKYEADGISCPAPGFGYSHRLTANNNQQGGTAAAEDGNIDLPNGWNWHTGYFQLVDMGSSKIRCVGRGTSSCEYKDPSSSGTYNGTCGVDAKIVHNTTPKEMVLYATNGTTATFYDFDSANGGKKGACKKVVDSAGNQLVTDFYTHAESTNLEDMIQKLTDSGGHDWVYTYIDYSGDTNNRRIQKIELKDGSTVLGKNEYVYYDSSSSAFASGSGTNGDLMRIIVTERDSSGLNLQRTSMFRYWTGSWSSSNKGAAHKVKYIVSPQGYKELAASISPTDPLKATDAQIATYADYYLEYDTNSFITLATVRTGGCSCSGGGQGTYTYSYSTSCRNFSCTDEQLP